jgi:Beta-propeller repeat
LTSPNYGNLGRLEYDFIVKPGATPNAVSFEFKGVSAPRLLDGDLVMSSGKGEIRQQKPVAYQEIDGSRRGVDARYVLLDGGRIGFEVGAYDRRQPLVIDPQLIYSLYMFDEQDMGGTVDAAGNVYVCGATMDSVYEALTDAFVVKINSTGTAVIYRNFFGVKGGSDQANAIAADAAGNAYVTGHTSGPTNYGIFQPLIQFNRPTMATRS